MAHKGKRGRKWAANKKLTDVPDKGSVITPNNQGIPTWSGNDQDLGQLLDWLYQWAEDMHAWGQDVRDDIVRLEGFAGFASGDPGDPPDGPPNGP